MNGVKLHVDVDTFVRDINRVKQETGRSSEEMLKYAMIYMLRAGRNNTPVGKKLRKLETLGQASGNTESDTDTTQGDQSQKGLKFFSVFHQRRKEPDRVFLPKIPRKSKKNEAARAQAIREREGIIARFKVIKRRGLAKASWSWAMKMLNSKRDLNNQADNLAGIVRNNPIRINKELSSNHPSIEVINRLGWIKKLTPGIEQMMIDHADAQMMHALDKQLQGAIDRAERRAS